MNKALLGASALIAAGLVMGSASIASAADPIKLGVSGEINQWMGGGNSDDQTSTANGGGVDTTHYTSTTFFTDNGIKFSGSTTLDNGIKVAAVMSYDGDTGLNRNHNFVRFTSDQLGQFVFGLHRGAHDTLTHHAPGVGIGNIGGDYSQFVRDSCTSCMSRAWALDHTRANGFTYYTPRIGGAGIGVSFGANQNQAEPGVFDMNTAAGLGHKSSVAFVYESDISGVGVGFDVGYTNDNGDSNDLSTGLNLSMNGFTVGGNWGRLVVDPSGADTYGNEGQSWDIGASYETGPYSVSLNYSDTDARGNANVVGKDTRRVVVGSVAYAVGAGLDIKGSVFHIDTNNEANTYNSENSAVGAAVGVSLGF